MHKVPSKFFKLNGYKLTQNGTPKNYLQVKINLKLVTIPYIANLYEE